MPITWRPAIWSDIGEGLSIQPNKWGDALVGAERAIKCWKQMVRSPFFASALLSADPAIRGHRLIGFGCSIPVLKAFVDAEIANPRPDINSRAIAGIDAGRPVLATWNEVARANARDGVDILILFGSWHDEILSPAERYDVQTILASSFTEWHRGYRIKRIIFETADEPARDFAERSVVYRTVAAFPECGRVLHLMTSESVKAAPASLGNILFGYREPLLGLRYSDQELLQAALSGTTDLEIAADLGVTFAAVKARWRSTFARFAEVMPDGMADEGNCKGRGVQKRHRVLAYVRNHPEELRPFDWKEKREPLSGAMREKRPSFGPQSQSVVVLPQSHAANFSRE
ncbi:MAG TPA: hypothetical protein VGG56_10150 [Terracidiphilus sp.]|jgi:hypothetical protein